MQSCVIEKKIHFPVILLGYFVHFNTSVTNKGTLRGLHKEHICSKVISVNFEYSFTMKKYLYKAMAYHTKLYRHKFPKERQEAQNLVGIASQFNSQLAKIEE